MTTKNKSLQEWVREDKLLLVEDASGKQSLYKQSANTNDKLLLYVAETAQEMKNYFRTRNVGAMPEVMTEKRDEKFGGLAQYIQGSIEDNQQRRLVTSGKGAVDEFGRPMVTNDEGDWLPAVVKSSGPRTPKGGIVNLGDKDTALPSDREDDMEVPAQSVRPKGHGPDEAKEKDMSNKLEEASMFQGGPDNMTTGNSPMDYRTYLAAELFGSTSFASQVPTADTHQAQVAIQGEQAVEGMGVLRPSGAPANNMYEQSISNQLIKLTKNLFRAGKIDEAAKIADALEQPQNAAAFVLEAAMSTDGSVDEKLTEDLYRTAAILNNLEG